MKTFLSIITSPFKWIAGSSLSNSIVQIFKKLPWLLGMIAFFVTLLIMFINYGIR